MQLLDSLTCGRTNTSCSMLSAACCPAVHLRNVHSPASPGGAGSRTSGCRSPSWHLTWTCSSASRLSLLATARQLQPRQPMWLDLAQMPQAAGRRVPSADSSRHLAGEASCATQQHGTTDHSLHVKIEAAGRWNAVAFWFELDMGCGSGSRVASWQAGASDGDRPAAVGAGWQQSVQYLDGMTVQQVRVSPCKRSRSRGQVSSLSVC